MRLLLAMTTTKAYRIGQTASMLGARVEDMLSEAKRLANLYSHSVALAYLLGAELA